MSTSTPSLSPAATLAERRSSLRDAIRSIAGFSSEPDERLDGFYGMLETRLSGIPLTSPPDERRAQVVEILTATPRTWIAAYRAEELMIWIVPDADLGAAFAALASEAKRFLPEAQVKQHEAAYAQATGPSAQRHVTKSLAEDLHELWEEEDERLGYFNYITERTARSVAFTLLLLVATLLLVMNHLAMPPVEGEVQRRADMIFPSLHSLRLLAVVLASGAFGAALSMLLSLQGRLDNAKLADLEKMAPWMNRLARIIFGAGTAIVLFGLIVSEAIKGQAIPALAATSPLHTRDFAHLVVLCIAAGFSEKMVPTRLTNLAGS